HKLGSAVDDRHNVLQVVAHTEVVLSTSVECLQLRSQKIRRGYNADYEIVNTELHCVLQGGTIPAVAEAKDRGIDRHEVQDQISGQPAADRCVVHMGFAKSQLPQLLFK